MLVSHACEWCGESFTAHDYKNRRFCSRTCRTKKQNSIDNLCPSREELMELYDRQRLTPQQLGERFGVQDQTVRKWLRRLEINVRQAQESTRFAPGLLPANQKPMPDKLTLEYLYCDWRLTTTQIGEHFQVSGVTVGKWLRRHGIDTRSAGIGLAARGLCLPTDVELRDMIHVQRLTYREVGDRYGVDQSAVQHWLDQRGIERPNIKGWQGAAPYKTPGGQIVRSSYEKAVTEWLQDNGLDFVYEPSLPFVGRADFLVNGWYIEVWGVVNSTSYKERKATKQNLYKAHGLPLIELPARSFDKKRGEPWKRRIAHCLLSPP